MYLFHHLSFRTLIYYIVTTYLLSTYYINLVHSFQLSCFSCFSDILFIIQLFTTAMLGRYPGCNDMAWQMNPMRKAFHWNAPQIDFAVYVMLYIPHTDFFNMIHLWTIVQHVKCTFLDCFYTHLQLQRAISDLILISSHLLSAYVSYTWWVQWYGMADDVPCPIGRYFIDRVQKSFFTVCILLYFPKNIFSTSWIWWELQAI